MSSNVALCTTDERKRLASSTYVRAAIFGVAWLPLLAILALVVPQFEGLFDSLRSTAELPAVTDWLVWFAWWNRSLFFAPFLLAFVLLVVCDVGLASLMRRSARRWPYWLWFAGVVVTGILATVAATTALLIPNLKMSADLMP